MTPSDEGYEQISSEMNLKTKIKEIFKIKDTVC